MEYVFAIDGSSTPNSGWAAVTGVYTDVGCTSSASDGAIGVLYAQISGVAFNQDSGTLNTIRIRVSEMASNQGIQANAFVIKIDSTAPSNFTLYSPTTWTSDLTPTVILSFTADLSGVDISTVQYAHSNVGSLIPTNWASVSGVYTDAGCTIAAVDGSTGTLYAKIEAVPDYTDSAILNTIRIIS